MTAFVADYYAWIKALHIISVVAWMAGLLYLPRLFVYHSDAKVGSELSETLKIMERRLLRGIMNPALIAAWAFGLLLLSVQNWSANGGWLHAKLSFVAFLTVFHMLLARWRAEFAADRNARPQRFYRIANELPTLALIAIVILVVVKPF